MKRFLLYTVLITLFVGVCSHSGMAQKSSEEELKEANKLFEDGKYKEAAPLYLKKLSVDQKSGEYNFKYGTCILYSDGDKKQGLRYLKFASQIEGTDTRVWFHLGKAYHLNYMFSDAVKSYNKFITLNPKDKEKYQVQKEIDACNFGKQLLKTITEVQVVSRKEFTESNFFYAYKLDGIGGQMALINGLQSDMDKKKNHNVIVYFPDKKVGSSTIFYSSYGKDGKSGKDIYKVNRLPDGSFGTPQIVNGPINTGFDEDFPYMHPDGRTFYFASKGHNSMGGYDIFRCYYDQETNEFSAPENVDFAINTPGDDYLYVTDSTEKMAFFASTRESPSGKINVYNVFVDRLPINIAILKGNFINEINETYLSAAITIEDVATGEVVGIFNTNRNTGSYLITLPKGGKYKFSVVGESQVVHTGIVEVPPSKELKPLKQELVLTKEENKEILKIRNLFDEAFENVDEILAEVFLGQAKLDPNADPNDTIAGVGIDKSDSADVQADEDVLAVAKKDADLLQQEYEDAKVKMEGAYAFAAKKQNDAKEKSDKANDLIKEAGQTTNEDEKEQLIKAANELNEEAAKDNAMAVAGFNLGKGMESEVEQKKKDAEVAREFEKGIEKAVNSKNHQEVIAELKKQQEFVKNVMGPDAENKTNEDQLRIAASDKKKEVDKQKERLDALSETESDLIKDIASLEEELKNPNLKKDRKKEIESILPGKKSELSDTQAQIAANDKKYKQLIGEQNEIEQQLAVITGITEGVPSLTQAEKDKLAAEIKENDVAATIEKNKSDISTQQDQSRTDREKNQNFLAENSKYNELTKKKEQAANNPDKKAGLGEEKKINEEIITELNKAETALNEQLKTESDPEKKKEIEKQLTEVKNIKQEKAEENTKIEKDLAALNNDNNTSTEKVELTAEREKEITNNAVPGYDDKLKSIEASNDPEKEKLADKMELNNQVIAKTDDRIKEINNQLPNLSGDEKKKALVEIGELEQLKDKTEQENKSHQSEIARIEKEEKVIVPDTTTVATTDNTFVKENNEKIAQVDPGYETRMEEIRKSNDSEVKKEYETRKANEDLVKEIEKKETQISNDPNLSAEEKKEQLADLKDLKDKTEKEIAASDDKLKEKGVEKSTVDVADVKSTDYTDPNAQKTAVAVEKKMDVIEEKEKGIDQLTLEIAETSDPGKKKELEKKLAADKKTYYAEINKVAPEIEKMNAAEYAKSNQNIEKIKKDILKTGSPDTENAKYKEAVQANDIALSEKREAEAYREKAKNESDPAKKALYNTEAADREKNAIEASKKAERLFAEYQSEMPVSQPLTVSNISEEKKVSINEVNPEYLKEVAAIENSGDSKEEKSIRKNELNEELLRDIEKEELKVKTDFSIPEEEKKEKLEKLDQLRVETESEMARTDDELRDAGIADPRNSDVKYESLAFDSKEAETEVADVKKDLTELEKMKKEAEEARRNYLTIEDEKLKNLAKKDLEKKDQAIAKKEIAVSDDLQAANAKDWEKLNADYISKKEIASEKVNMPADDRRKMASELEREAKKDKEDAEQLRKQAANEKDLLKKADLLREAYQLESDANDKMKKAGELMDRFIADGMTAKLVTETKDQDGNVIVPENKEERSSSQARKLAGKELQIADSLNNLAVEYEKKAEKGNKKSKEENKKEAQRLRDEAASHQELSNNLYAKANEEEKKEEVLVAEQTKRKEEEQIRNEKKEAVKTMPEYVEYYDIKKKAEDKKAAGDKAKAAAEQQGIIADNTRKEAEETKEKAASESDPERKNQLGKTAQDLTSKANVAERKEDSLNQVAEKYYAESSSFNWDVDNYLKKIDSKKAEDILLATADGKLPDPDRSVVAATNPTNPDFVIPTVINNDVFAKTEKSVYSEENPIPINPKTPSGPYLKVQVGAFRNPIKQSLYSEFAPVTGEARGDGLTRYTVGYFTTLESATKARDEIRAMGYKDAFVVGYEDGQKTSVANVLNKLGGVADNLNPTNPTNTNPNNTNPTNTNPTNTNPTNTNPTNTNPSNEDLIKPLLVDDKKDDYYTGTPNAAKANQIEVIQGLFYTVQVGVYSKPVTPDKIFNLSPLNSELITRNNWIRYTTGIYTNYGKADTRKEEIRTIGVKDAFVVAYINGNKITPEKADELLKQYGDSILVKVDANGNPIKGANTSNINSNNTDNNLGGNNSGTPTSNKSYKVILGEYTTDVPGEDAAIYMGTNEEKIQRKTSADGVTTFFIDGIPTKANADKVVEKYREKGLKKVRIEGEAASVENREPVTPVVKDPVTPTGNNENTAASARKMKEVNGLIFQVYLGEFVSELPEDMTAIILNNMSKGIKRKDSPNKNTIYYTGDFKSYEKAMEEKAYFFVEGITDVKVVAFYQSKEISITEALNMMYE